jgi:hypothetical protein
MKNWGVHESYFTLGIVYVIDEIPQPIINHKPKNTEEKKPGFFLPEGI